MQATLQRVHGWTFDALCRYLDEQPELNWRRFEILDGTLVVSPEPVLVHDFSEEEIRAALRPAVPAGYRIGGPGIELGASYLVPDVVVARVGAFARGRKMLHPDEILLAIEIESPSSVSMDRLVKPAKYAAAGIRGYWRLEPEPRLVAHILEDGVYREVGSWGPGETARLEQPFPVEIRLDELVPPTAP